MAGGHKRVGEAFVRQVVEERGMALAETARHFGVTTAAICMALQRAKVN